MNFDKIIPLVAAVVIAAAVTGKLDALTLWVYKAQAKLVYESRASTWGSPRFFPEYPTKKQPNKRRCLMTAALNIQKVPRPPSIEMKAVLEILNADSFLLEATKPHINFDNENIYWDKIFQNSFGSGHRGALLFAYAIWTDEVRSNPFDAAFSMSPQLQTAVLKAMAMRWGLMKAPINEYNQQPTKEVTL